MRLIDGEQLLEKAYEAWGVEADAGDTSIFMDMILDAPVVDPVKHGEWIPTMNFGGINGYNRRVCSVCEANFDSPYSKADKYCPNCGAKMDLED